MNQQQLARHLQTITELDSILFQKELQSLKASPFIIPLLSQLLSSTLTHHQKQLAATGINRICLTKIEVQPKQWPLFWDEFRQQVLLSCEVNKIEWRHLNILSKSVQGFMEEFDCQFCKIVNSIFEGVPFKVKVLIYEAFLHVDTSISTKFVFLRETVELFLKETFDYLCWLHDSNQLTIDNLALEAAVINTLYLLLTNLEKLYGNQYGQQILQSLSLNDDLFFIVVEELLFDGQSHGYSSVKSKSFSVQRIGELVLVSKAKDQLFQKHSSSVKAEAIRIFMVILGMFDKKSMIQEFDHYKQLHLMENLAPIVVSKLINLASNKSINESNEIVAIALMDWLSKITKFNFLLQFFDSQFQSLFFQVCYPFLAVDDEEAQLFREDGEAFIKITEEMVERLQQKDSTLKNASSDLIQKIIQTLDGSLLFVVNRSIQIIRYVLIGENQMKHKQQGHKYGCEWSVQTALTILSIFSDQYPGRSEILLNIKENLLDLPEVTKLEGIALAKLLLLLAYTYHAVYGKQQNESTTLLLLAAHHLGDNSTLCQCSLVLFSNCISFGFGNDIWSMLLGKIQTSKSAVELMQIMKKIIQEKMDELPVPYVQELIEKVTQRLIYEYKICQQQAQGGLIRGSQTVFKCLVVLQEISQNRKYLKTEQAIIETLWPIFDLFEFADKIEFEDNILVIFNNVVAASSNITQKHFSFLKVLPIIHQKLGGFTPELSRTFVLLLSKGRQHFVFERCVDDLQNTLRCLKECYKLFKKEESLRQICIFFQWAYSEFSSLLKKDEELLSTIFEIYQQSKQLLQEQTLAAITNLFMTEEVKFGNSQMGIIQQNSICIFKDYQAEIASTNFKYLIEKYSSQEQVIDYLKYSIRLLHYIRTLAVTDQAKESSRRKKYFRPNFQGAIEIDPFQEVLSALDFLKRHLQTRRYDELMENLSEQISLGQIKDLVSRRIVDKGLRTIYKVKTF